MGEATQLMDMTVQEFGSDFHLCFDEQFLSEANENPFLNDRFSLFFSGRSAVYSLLQLGILKHGWKKVFFPTYYCHEVEAFCDNLPIEILHYEFNPFVDSEEKEIDIEDEEYCVVINVTFFGLKRLKLSNLRKACIVDDVTHDILAFDKSEADYCIGSLRKVLPLPCGGFCYSPLQKELPQAESNAESEKLGFQKATAMFLKSEYLEGRFKQKDFYRNVFIDAESKFGDEYTAANMPSVAKGILAGLNISSIAQKKRENLAYALSRLKENRNISYNLGLQSDNALGLVLNISNKQEQANLKAFLVSKNIYPAILWPNQITSREVESSNATLFLHVDFRYEFKGIEYITDTLNSYIAE